MEDDSLKDILSRATKYLLEAGCIRVRRKERVTRCVRLHLQTIFDQLVSLYIPLFQCQWQRLKYLFDEAALLPSGITPRTHATRCYISAWIHDLYVSNRKAVQTLCSLTFLKHYSHEEVYCSSEYDAFLIHLNADIRPTHIKGTPEDTVYVPVLSDSPAWGTDNPFNIENFVLDHNLVRGIIATMKGYWRTSTVVSDNLGRPFWLLDWHEDCECCAWFPRKGNYTMEDVTVAYILGAACTPNLGFRDVDDWQNGIVPENVNPLSYDRVKDRHFYGGYEVRTIERRQIVVKLDEETLNRVLEDHRFYSGYEVGDGKQRQIIPIFVRETTQGPPPNKRKKTKDKVSVSNAAIQTGSEYSEAITIQTGTESSKATAIQTGSKSFKATASTTVDQFQIVDWTYYHRVILCMDSDTRSQSLWEIVQNLDC